MQINHIVFNSVHFNEILKIENYIVLNEKIHIKKNYLNQEIIELLLEYGKKILNLVPKSFITNQELDNNSLEHLFNIFIDFYKEIGYTPTDSDIYNNSNSSVVITKKSIFDLTTNIIKFNMFYELYSLFLNSKDNNNLVTTNMELILENFIIDDYSKIFLLDTINNELKNYGKKANLEFDFKLTGEFLTEATPSLNMVSNDIYVLGLYILCDNIFNVNDTHNHKYKICKNCKKIMVRAYMNQQYCSDCRKLIDYGRNTDLNKIEIINKLNSYKGKVHFEDTKDINKFNEYCSLTEKGNSRKRAETKKDRLSKFLKRVEFQYEKENNITIK